MSYLKAYLRNLLLLFLVIIGTAIFTKIFYPEALSFFPAIEEIVSGFKLWPIVIAMILVSALPRRR